MARPRTDIGTYGKINVREVRPGVYEARARFRLRNGRLKPVKRRGKSPTAAERALKAAMVKLADETDSKKINPDTRFGHVLDLWLKDFKKKVDRGERAAKSLYDYRDSADQIRRYMGELACREAENAGLCDETLKSIRAEAAKTKRSKNSNGYAAAKRARTVLTQTCGYAVRHEAMRVNPAKGAERIEVGDAVAPVRALEPAERGDFLAKLRAWCAEKAGSGRLGPRGQAWLDLPDVVEGMLATGARPGEMLATIGDSVVPGQRTARLDHHLVRIEGEGIVRKPLRKGRRDALNPRYPMWAAAMFTRRKLAAGGGPLFPTWNGQWQDPGNVAKRMHTACDAIGFGWVSARMLRHTVGTHLGDSGVSSELISDQLGNTAPVVERHYRRKKVTNAGTAAALESLFDGQDTGS